MSRAQSVEIRDENTEYVVEVEIHVGFSRRCSISPSPLTTLPARHPDQLWSLNLYDHLLSPVIGANTDPVIMNRLPFLVRLPEGSRRLESAVSKTALPKNTGHHTL